MFFILYIDAFWYRSFGAGLANASNRSFATNPLILFYHLLMRSISTSLDVCEVQNLSLFDVFMYILCS